MLRFWTAAPKGTDVLFLKNVFSFIRGPQQVLNEFAHSKPYGPKMKYDTKCGIKEAHGNIQWTNKQPLLMQVQIRMSYYSDKNY